MIDPESTRDLRDALVSSERDARPLDSCPTPESLWSAVRGEASREQIRDTLRHVMVCGACSESWRLAREVSEESATRRSSTFRPGARIAAGLAAAALAGIALLVLLRDRPFVSPSSYRQEAAPETVRALTSDGASLSRSAFVLRWQDLGKDTRYDVTVYTEDLVAIGGARDLDRPELTVPAESFRNLPAGSRLAWKVVASLPNGRRIASGAYLVVLADASAR